MEEFKLPDLGEGMQEAEIRRWLIKPGDIVKLDQPMVEVETDKAVVEIPSPVAARVADIRVQEGKTAKLGEVLITFETATGSTQGSTSSAIANNPVSETQTSVTVPNENSSIAISHRVLAAPAVRKRAFELDIDLAQVTPSQPGGRVTMEDIQAYIEHQKTSSSNGTNGTTATTRETQPATITQKTEPVQVRTPHINGSTGTAKSPVAAPVSSTGDAEERQPLTGLRKRIAERMERSWRIVPHATSFEDIDGTELAALRTMLKPIAEQRGVRLTYMPLLVKLLIPVLKEFPIFNASLDEETREIVYKHSYHIGIATDTPEGLLVPVLRNADKLTVIQIAQQLEHLINAAQKRSLTMQEASGSTFTLNNVGSFGHGTGTPIINYPEVAILAVGRLQEKAIVQHGAIIARTMMPLAMSFDHRLIDGALAGKFLSRFQELVEHPQQLLLDMM